ncbi:hypothetical protein Droror1_Dr00017330 [Drosera rotundifolia]
MIPPMTHLVFMVATTESFPPQTTSDSDHLKKNSGPHHGLSWKPSLAHIRSFSKQSLAKRDGYKKLSLNSSKSSSGLRWLMFGSMRLPGKMELEEIRSRQSRQSPKVLFGLCDDDDDDDPIISRKKTIDKGKVGSGYDDEHRPQHHRGIAVVPLLVALEVYEENNEE